MSNVYIVFDSGPDVAGVFSTESAARDFMGTEGGVWIETWKLDSDEHLTRTVYSATATRNRTSEPFKVYAPHTAVADVTDQIPIVHRALHGLRIDTFADTENEATELLKAEVEK